MSRFLVVLYSNQQFEMEEPDCDRVLATLHKRGYSEQIESITLLDDNTAPILPSETDHATTDSFRQLVLCPLCGTKMVISKKSDGGEPYWRCSAFPRCKGTREISDNDL